MMQETDEISEELKKLNAIGAAMADIYMKYGLTCMQVWTLNMSFICESIVHNCDTEGQFNDAIKRFIEAADLISTKWKERQSLKS